MLTTNTSGRPIKGVNLGGWLVLEPWITPSLFAGTAAVDEYGLCQLGGTALRRLERHRNQWITERDVAWLAAHGFTAVRLPVGHWIFGGSPPYVGAISYVDRLFDWAERHGVQVLLCLHGAPGSQNGKMHSGRQGQTDWHRGSPDDPAAYVRQSLQVIERLAERYAGRPGLLGIELLNEPSAVIPRRILRRYYRTGYAAIRRRAGRDVWVVFSDRFKPWLWAWSFGWPRYRSMVQDTHRYQIYTPADRALDVAGHVAKVRRSGHYLRWLAGWRRLIVGEWSLALDPQSLRDATGRPLTGPMLDRAYADYLAAQLTAFSAADAWFYWTYRTEDNGPWNLRSTYRRHVTNFTDPVHR